MAFGAFDPRSAEISVFDALVRARRAAGGKKVIVEDHDRKPLTFDDLIRAAFALGGRLKGMTEKGETVAVLLPTGVGCTAVFFALHAIGRVPAMLNFTAGAMNLKAACQAAGVKRILTAQRFVEQGKLEPLVEELSTVATVTFLEDVRAKISLGDKLGALMAGLAPGLFRTKRSADDTAVILFTSGSFGAPRGVALSHRNLVANVEQAAAHIEFKPEWVFFNPLPMFHCFGLTAGTLLPILTGHKAVLYPSPLHFKEIPKLIKETGSNVLFATDTFAMQYARSSKSDELKGLFFAVLGAERVREDTRAAFDKIGVELLEGYGATEASPVIAVNQPGKNAPGTTGKILPGIEVRLEQVPGITSGAKLLVRGPNIMKGYLNKELPEGFDPPAGGWHDTGDVVTIDDAGCVKIIGRVKRFAKIGGEMVSLAAVEGYAAALWPEHRHAAVTLPCPRKGERVVLITDHTGASAADLQAWAHQHGAPEIAIPKRILPMPEIPVLGSGKTDYVAVQQYAASKDDGSQQAA